MVTLQAAAIARVESVLTAWAPHQVFPQSRQASARFNRRATSPSFFCPAFLPFSRPVVLKADLLNHPQRPPFEDKPRCEGEALPAEGPEQAAADKAPQIRPLVRRSRWPRAVRRR